MNKSKVIKQLEQLIEVVKDENNYITSVTNREMPDVEKVIAHSDKGAQVVGLKEVGKNIYIDIDVEYIEYKNVDLEADE